MMEFFVVFVKKIIYILLKGIFLCFFFEIVKNLVVFEKYFEYCEILIINFYIVWKL